MCGIAGALNLPFYEQPICDLMHHRGPNAKGSYHHNTQGGLLQLFHTRLSIQDPSPLANQPMQKHDCHLVFNGEIYNHQDLRSLLQMPFYSQSDSETLLALYNQWGIDFLSHLDGMFAFVIYDKSKQLLFFARDRMGKKPLFFYHRQNKLLFASELNTLYGMFDFSLDLSNLAFFLQAGFFWRDKTPYEGIESFPPGSYGIYYLQSHRFILKKYFDWKWSYTKPKIHNKQAALLECEHRLKQSIQSRLHHGFKMGAFLSGGIDSGLLVALANAPLHTFTLALPGYDIDESKQAQHIAKQYNTIHHTIYLPTQIGDEIFNILKYYGRPFGDSSAIPSYYLARAAREHVSIVLNGDGADELFGGYRRYVGHLLAKKLPFLSRLAPFFYQKGQKASSLYYLNRLAKLSFYEKKQDYLAYYLSATTDLFDNLEGEPFQACNDEIKELFSLPLDRTDKLIYLDWQYLLLCNLLPKIDIASMANSLECRSPFLSKAMLEFAIQLDSKLKVSCSQTKILLRQLAKKYLPSQIASAPKKGFEVPLHEWVNHTFCQMIFDLLHNAKLLYHFIPKTKIQKLCFEPQAFNPQRRAKMLWNLFVLEAWYQGQKAHTPSPLAIAHPQ